jgi:hypothetical protein
MEDNQSEKYNYDLLKKRVFNTLNITCIVVILIIIDFVLLANSPSYTRLPLVFGVLFITFYLYLITNLFLAGNRIKKKSEKDSFVFKAGKELKEASYGSLALGIILYLMVYINTHAEHFPNPQFPSQSRDYQIFLGILFLVVIVFIIISLLKARKFILSADRRINY